MNERIRELMLEAGYAAPEIATRGQQLAELIVRECIVTLQDHMGRGKRDDYYRGQSDSIRLLKQHFGVEE